MKNRFILLISILSLSGCGFGTWSISELAVQKIEGTSKVIYFFSAWGGLDSNPHGFIILDSSKTFKVDVHNILPLYYLSDIPDKYSIEGVSHECFNSCGDKYSESQPVFTPMRTDKSEFNGIKITNRVYQYRGFSERQNILKRFVFEKFKETEDSLFFYNLDDVESMNGSHLDELRIKKGDVYLHQDENKHIKKITIRSIMQNKINNAIEDSRTYFLTPKQKTAASEFSERGIFRDLQIPK